MEKIMDTTNGDAPARAFLQPIGMTKGIFILRETLTGAAAVDVVAPGTATYGTLAG
jgi:hypothetical protein